MDTKIIGIHEGCGGEVIYASTPSMGYRYCMKCGANTRKGQLVDVQSDKVQTVKS